MQHIVELMDKRLIGRGAGNECAGHRRRLVPQAGRHDCPSARQPKSAQQGNSQFPVLTIRGALPDAAEGQQNHICLGFRCYYPGNPKHMSEACRAADEPRAASQG